MADLAEPAAAAPEPPADAISRVTLLVVSHTHWDREWYLPFQLYRIKLVRLIDRLLWILANRPDYAYFMLDGQTVVLEDYLEVRPDAEEALAEHISSGRVLAGPWYILPDEFLVSGEAIIRNLLRGHAIARAFGGVMPVGYVPDPFGQISQLPQILRGFGLGWAVFWRGVGDVGGTEFIWRGPDGSQVLTTHLPRGYSNGLPLNATLAAARNQVRWILNEWADRRSTNTILVMNGDDHQLPSPHLPDVLAALNAELAEEGVVLVHGTLPQYRAAVTEQLFGGAEADPALGSTEPAARLHVQTGELRLSRYMHLLPGVLSARMWIKQANHAAETLLERWVEPWEALHWALAQHTEGQDWERDLALDSAAALRSTAWKYLLHNQPHDSICGCSIDAVHDEMRTRYAAVEQIGGELVLEGLRGVAGQVNTGALPTGVEARGRALLVFNPLAGPRTDLAQVTVQLPASLSQFALYDDHGALVPIEVVERHHQELARFDLDAANLEVALAMAADGRINGMVVSDVHLHAGDEPGVLDVDITVSDSGEPDDVLLQSLADAARRMVATGTVRTFRLRGLRPEEVTFRFLAADVPGPGYRSYVLAAEGTEMPPPVTPRTQAAPPAPAPPPGGGPPRSAAIFQPDPHEEVLPEVIAESEPYPGVPTVGAMDPTEGYLIENDFYVVEAAAQSGWLTITDKQTGLVVSGGNRFVDAGDCGDEYTYCPPAEDQVITGFSAPPRIDMHYTPLGSSLIIEGTLLLPAWLSEDRRGRSAAQVTCPVRSTVRLLHGVRRVDISTTVDNQAGDHWLRVMFDVPVQTDVSEAEGTFDVLSRPLDLPEADSSWREQPVPTHPQKTWVAVGDGQRGVLLANRGLPEYEVLRRPDGAGVTLALTLLRCVGWLSRDDLTTRQGHAGPGLPTPGAQCLGLTRFDYALVPFAGTWQTSRAYHQAHSFNVPLRALTEDFHPGPLPPTDTLVIIEPDDLVISALKRSADGEAVILRAWNISDAPVQARIVPPPFLRAARLVRLDETPAAETGRVQSIPDAPGWRLDLRPREICTLRLEV